MGFLDKVKSQAESLAKQGQEKVDEVQAKRRGEALIRDLGAWYYAIQTGRDDGKGPGELARITSELQAHEAEHGPLGSRDADADADADAEPATPAAPAASPAPAPAA
ncbi:MAG TPA: hypothetical protein VGM93_06555, partial [Acidimicrobiales bacterium]